MWWELWFALGEAGGKVVGLWEAGEQWWAVPTLQIGVNRRVGLDVILSVRGFSRAGAV
jgi:hypothetical protein